MALGTLKRVILSVLIDDDDRHMFCGTESGDVLKIQLNSDSFLYKVCFSVLMCVFLVRWCVV